MKIMIYYVNNFRNKDKFTKKLEKSCWLSTHLHFLFKYFSKYSSNHMNN